MSGNVAARPSAVVVTPGRPFVEQTAISGMTSYLPVRSASARVPPAAPRPVQVHRQRRAAS